MADIPHAVGGTPLRQTRGGENGPAYGRTVIDYKLGFPWDLKAQSITPHPAFTSLNDIIAVNNAINDFGGVGFLIGNGIPELDADGSFREWHVEFSGGPSAYSERRKSEGAPSRTRKAGFYLKDVVGFFLSSHDDVRRALAERWLTERNQAGMRNSNDNIRNAKYGVIVERIPSWSRI